MKSLQRGAFLMARALLVVLILLAMLIIPIWLKKRSDDKMNAGMKAEQAKNTGSGSPGPSSPPTQQADGAGTVTTGGDPVAVMANSSDSAAVSGAPRQISHGLTFAISPVPSAVPAPVSGGGAPAGLVNLAHLSCHGEPRQVDQPHRESCNPYKGDTSCRVVLPVLCFQSKGLPQPSEISAGAYQGWSGGVLGATQPVMGAILTSDLAGSARCEKELGPGWRMAEFHDAGGWGMQGQRGLGLAPNTRFWVHINDQPGNCWDSKP